MGRCANCPKYITKVIPEGTVVLVLTREIEGEDLLATGAAACGAWGPWSAWSICILFVRYRSRSRTCTRTDRIQQWTRCHYMPTAVGVVGYALTPKAFCPPKNRVVTWTEYDRDYEVCLPFITQLLLEGLGLPGYQVFDLSLGGASVAKIEQHARLAIQPLDLPDTRIREIAYVMDGKTAPADAAWQTLDPGCHLFQVVVTTDQEAKKVFNIPFEVAPRFSATVLAPAAGRLGAGAVGVPVVLTNNFDQPVTVFWSLKTPPELGEVSLQETVGGAAENPLTLLENEARPLTLVFRVREGDYREQDVRSTTGAATLTFESGSLRTEAVVQAPAAALADQLAFEASLVQSAFPSVEAQPVVRIGGLAGGAIPVGLSSSIAGRLTAPGAETAGLAVTPFATQGYADPLDAVLATAMREILIRGLSTGGVPSAGPQLQVATSPQPQPASTGEATGQGTPAGAPEGEQIDID